MKLIKKNFKANNILKIWLVSFIIIPLFIFVMKFAWNDTTDRFVFTWLFLIIGSIGAQFFINVFRKVKSGKFQYLFILIVMNVTMFLTYVLKYHTSWMDAIQDVWMQWFGDLLVSVVISAILFIIKTLVWIGLMVKYKELEQNNKKRIELEKQNINLEKEHLSLKEKYELELEQKAAREMDEAIISEHKNSMLEELPSELMGDIEENENDKIKPLNDEKDYK